MVRLLAVAVDPAEVDGEAIGTIGIPAERIARLGDDDNWWGPPGKTGPAIDDYVYVNYFTWQVLSADTQDLLGLRPYMARYPGRFIEVGIAEQNMISVAAGAAAGFDAVLVGEMLVKAVDPTTTVRGLADIARPGR